MPDQTYAVLTDEVVRVADGSETWERLWWALGSLLRERLAALDRRAGREEQGG